MRQYIERLASLEWSRIVLGAILFGGLYYYFSFADSSAGLDVSVQAAEHKLVESKNRLDRTMSADKNVKVFVQRVEEAQKQFNDVISYMPPEINNGNFLQQIKDQASAAGATLQSANPLSDTNNQKRDFYETSKYDLQLSGSFSQLVQFLANISKMPFLITFEKVQITAGTTEGDIPKLNFKGTLLRYRYVKDVVAKTDKPAATK